MDDKASYLPETAFLQYGKQKLGSRFVGQVNTLSAFRIDKNLAEFSIGSLNGPLPEMKTVS
jgi:hypothetical protein